MASKKSGITVEVKGLNDAYDYLEIVTKGITKGFQTFTEREANVIREQMKLKIQNFRFKGGLEESIRIITNYEQDDKMSVSILTRHKSALQNEYGTRPRWLYVADNPELQEWIRTKMRVDPNNYKFLYIGGPNSAVKLGQSENKFFFNTVDEYIKSNPNKRMARRISKEINK